MYGSMECDGALRHRDPAAAPSLRRRESRLVRSCSGSLWSSRPARCGSVRDAGRMAKTVRNASAEPRGADRRIARCTTGVIASDHARCRTDLRPTSGNHELDAAVALPDALTCSLHGGRLLPPALAREPLRCDTGLDQEP